MLTKFTTLRVVTGIVSIAWLIACTDQVPDNEVTRYTSQVLAAFKTAMNVVNMKHEDLSDSTDARANMASGISYVKASIPQRIYECLREFSILRCTKLFVLQKMDERKQFPNSGNLTRDFIEEFFGAEQQLGSLTTEKYRHMAEKELNQRLLLNFQRFFKNRDIKLHFLPGMMVKIVPSKENKLKFSLRKKSKTRLGRALRRRESASVEGLQLPLNLGSGEYEGVADGGGDSKQSGGGGAGGGGGSSGSGGDGGKGGGIIGKRKKNKQSSYKTAMLQMAVPILVMPAILLGSLLPFVLPALKMATIMSLLMNNGAFLAALIYAARTHANSQEEQHISYGYGAGAYH